MQIIKAARGNITGHFGDTGVPGAHVPAHLGTDIGHGNMTAADLRVVAPAAGRVVAVGKEGTYGLRIVIEHDGTFSTILAHLAKALVVVGQLVDQGEEIAVMGNTGGNWPVHLHQELRKNGVPVDAEQYFAATAGGIATPLEDELDANQAAQLDAAEDNAAEARRLAAVIMGAAKPATPAELRFRQQQDGIIENVAETRRMLAVLLGVQKPAPGEVVPSAR